MAFLSPELIKKLEYGYYFWPVLMICGLVLIIFNYVSKIWFISRSLKWIKGPSTVPILGNSSSFIGKSQSDHWKISIEWLQKYNGLVKMWIFHRPTVLVAKHELVERILKGVADTLMLKNESYGYLQNVLGEGLLTSVCVEWNERRKLLNPFFHKIPLENYMSTMCHHARALVSHLRQVSGKGEIIDVQRCTKLSALDITVDSLLKASPNFLEQKDLSYINAAEAATNEISKRRFTPLYNWNIIYFFTYGRLLQAKASKTINEFSKKIISKREKSREVEKNIGDNSIQKTFLDYLLDNKNEKKLNGLGIQQEVNTFVFTGHETVSTAIAFTLYLLGRHPEIQERVHKEIKSAVPNIASENDITTTQVNKLHLLERCIKESLRLYPPIPWIGRILKNNIKIDEKCYLPEGANIAISVYQLHRDETYFKDANRFDPDRFLNFTEKDGQDNYRYIPFGAGWRNCIGQKFAMQEMKIILAHILGGYSIASLDKPEDLEITGNFILRSNNGLRLKITLRDK